MGGQTLYAAGDPALMPRWLGDLLPEYGRHCQSQTAPGGDGPPGTAAALKVHDRAGCSLCRAEGRGPAGAAARCRQSAGVVFPAEGGGVKQLWNYYPGDRGIIDNLI